ncbi:hypothetical protein [Streptomyces sp. TRM49041]|uniref:hypothetical protein n=1 Tax=Streptomyces sp. TRM49041 TaxID=2603216 RepID=UPI0011ED2E56|nr:hypothetical protein [Streptomyces sp. TRM49041]
MDARDTDLKRDLDATLHARRELGTEYESALVESFLEKVDERLDRTIDRRVRRRLAERQLAEARGTRPDGAPANGSYGERFGFATVSLVLAVPLSAIGVANAGFPGLVVAWLGIVGVNAVQAVRELPRRRGHDTDDAEDMDRIDGVHKDRGQL